ncbi:hypothetical protein NIES932_11320 [Raphidiopsis curvata NIES-932]|nr:hypothetical protein NIES932_11320 [Raphidiopsis curvata NIES-932]
MAKSDWWIEVIAHPLMGGRDLEMTHIGNRLSIWVN